MDYGLPFPIELVFLLIVLPIAFAYLGSVGGVALICLKNVWKKLTLRWRCGRPTPPERPVR